MKKFFALFILLCFCLNITACSKSISGPDAFAGYASSRYCSKSVNDDNAMFLTLNPDGTIEGQAYMYNESESSSDYENGTIYGNLFKFSLKKLKRIDEFTYSAVISEIVYDFEPDTSEIDVLTAEDGTTQSVRNVYTSPLDGNEKGSVRIILPNSMIGNIPENCYPYLQAFGYDTEDKNKILDTTVLYFENSGIAFVLLPE